MEQDLQQGCLNMSEGALCGTVKRWGGKCGVGGGTFICYNKLNSHLCTLGFYYIYNTLVQFWDLSEMGHYP